jgi:hypothetical protein
MVSEGDELPFGLPFVARRTMTSWTGTGRLELGGVTSVAKSLHLKDGDTRYLAAAYVGPVVKPFDDSFYIFETKRRARHQGSR